MASASAADALGRREVEVVRLPTVGTRQHVDGLREILKLRLGLGLSSGGCAVWMRLPRQSAKPLADLGLAGIPCDAEESVIVNVSRHLAGTSTAQRTIATEVNISERKGFGKRRGPRERCADALSRASRNRILRADVRTPSGRLRSRDRLRSSRMLRYLIRGRVIASGTAGLLTRASWIFGRLIHSRDDAISW